MSIGCWKNCLRLLAQKLTQIKMQSCKTVCLVPSLSIALCAKKKKKNIRKACGGRSKTLPLSAAEKRCIVMLFILC